MMSNPKSAINTEELLALIEQQLNTDPGVLSPTTALADIPGWDSMGVLLLMAEFDDRLGISLSTDTLANLNSVGDIIQAVNTAGFLAA